MQDNIKKLTFIIWIKFNKILYVKKNKTEEFDNKMRELDMSSNWIIVGD
jgi:hypothetical protein